MSLQETRIAGRPLWLPHPGLIGFIVLLWAAALTLQLVG